MRCDLCPLSDPEDTCPEAEGKYGRPKMDNKTTIVRCRECIFYEPENSCNWCSHPKGLCNPGESDFCSYGKEREKPINSAPLNQEERWLKTV